MVEQFIASLTNANTRGTYRRYVARFLEWLGEENLATLEAGELLDFTVYLREEQEMAASSVNVALAAVKEFLRWAALTKLVSAQVFAEAQLVRSLPTAVRLPEPLTFEQTELLLQQPDLSTYCGVRDYALMQFALSTGCRLAEMVALNVEDLDWQKMEVKVFGKGSIERMVLFDEDAAAALVFYLQQRGNPTTGPLFTNEHGGRVSHRWVQKAVKSYGQKAGLEVHPHLFRHTLATGMVEAGIGLHGVAQQLGHRSTRTTMRYTSRATSHRRPEYNAFVQHRKGGPSDRGEQGERLPQSRASVRVGN